MADNKTLTTTVATVPSGTVLASDEVGGVDYPRGKIALGDNGTVVDWTGGEGVKGTNTARISIATDDNAVTSLGLIDDAIVADDAAFTPATTKVMMAGFEFDDSAPDSVNEGDAGAARMSANRNVYTNIRDNAGNERGLNVAATGNISVDTVTTVTTVAAVTAIHAFVAHDTGVAGSPLIVGGTAQTMDDTAPPNRVSAEADATRLATSLDGAVFAHPHGPQVWSYHVNGSSALTDTTVHASPGAGLSLYVTDIVVSSGAATAMNVFFEEGATTVLGPYYLEAVAGRGVALHFQVPKKITAATALTVTTSAAIAHSVDVTGFTAPS